MPYRPISNDVQLARVIINTSKHVITWRIAPYGPHAHAARLIYTEDKSLNIVIHGLYHHPCMHRLTVPMAQRMRELHPDATSWQIAAEVSTYQRVLLTRVVRQAGITLTDKDPRPCSQP